MCIWHVFFALVVSIVQMASVQASSGPWRIMPMGDSITLGVGNEGGYRCPLTSLLDAHKINHVLVGPLQDKCGGHAGFNGRTIEQIAGYAKDAMAGSMPDVVTLQAGTNDFYFYRNGPEGLGANASVAATRLRGLLDILYAAKPNLTVALSTVTLINETLCAHYPEAPWHPAPCPSDMSDNIGLFNGMLPTIVAQQKAMSRRIALHDVNVDAKWEFADYFTWGIHFSEKGYQKMAASWLAALLPLAPETTERLLV